MRLEKFGVRGYRSIEELEFEFKDFAVLVGANNAGKSNIVRSLNFLSKMYSKGIDHAFESEGGFENIVFRYFKKREANRISFWSEVTATENELQGFPDFAATLLATQASEPPPREPYLIRHSFTIHGTGEPIIDEYQIQKERLEIRSNERPDDILLSFGRYRDQIQAPMLSEAGKRLLFPTTRLPEMAADNFMFARSRFRRFLLDRIEQPLSLVYRSYFDDVRLYDFAPSSCRLPASPNLDGIIGQQGANLPILVNTMKKRAPFVWYRVLTLMKRVLFGLEEIDVVRTHDRLLALNFVMEDGTTWLADEVSDGTIRALALFCVLYDAYSRIILFEEPENSLHPWMLRILLRECREATKQPGKRIVVTTHSPVLIDYAQPDELLVVWMERGRTQMRPLLKLEPAIRGTLSQSDDFLFDFLDGGSVRQAVPGFEL